MIISIHTLLQSIIQKIKAFYKNDNISAEYAWIILEEILQKKKSDLITTKTIHLTAQQQQTIDDWIEQLTIHHKPIQYLIGWVPFGNLTITVEPPILIPRPETEEWTYRLIDLLKPYSQQPLTILDLCTGTGCVALALAHAYPNFYITALDISPQAINLAKKNTLQLHINNVMFIESDLFENLPEYSQFDLIVANPPYIDPAVWNTLERSVTTWEDPDALIAPNEGLSLIKKIIEQAPNYLKQSSPVNGIVPRLWIEIGYDQKIKVVEFMKQHSYSNIQTFKDFAGKDRVVAGSNNVALTTRT